MGIFLSCGGKLRVPLSWQQVFGGPLELHKGSQASFWVLRGNSGLLSRQCREICPHLQIRWGTQGSSRVLVGTLGFLSSCNKNLGNLLCCIKGVRPLFQFWEGTRNCTKGAAGENALMSRWGEESHGFSWAVVGSLGFLSSYHMDFREPLVLPQGHEVSFQVARGTSGFLSSCCRGMGLILSWVGKLRVPLQFRRASRCSYRVSTGDSGLVSFWG